MKSKVKVKIIKNPTTQYFLQRYKEVELEQLRQHVLVQEYHKKMNEYETKGVMV